MSQVKKLLVSFISLVIATNFANISLAKINVVTSFPILEDIAYNIGKDKIDITSMIKRNQNPHNYDPSFSDIQNLYQADILIVNGLNFESWLKRATQQSNFKGELITTSHGIHTIHIEEDHEHEHEDDHEHGHDDHGHDHGDTDPHVWQNPLNGIIMAKNIANALIDRDPENADFYTENLNSYQKQLTELDQKIMAELQGELNQPLKAIVLHDSFRYFAERYPIQFFPILDAHSISEPSIKVFTGIQTIIQENQVPVIFSESMEQGRFINTIVKDYKIANGGQLISDTILEIGKGCDSYIAMLECNVKTMRAAFDNIPSK